MTRDVESSSSEFERPSVETGYLTEDLRSKILGLAKRYPDRRAAVTQALWLIQEEYGWLPAEAERELAEVLDLPHVWIREVVTFYNMYRQRPWGVHQVDVCCNLSCSLRGARSLFRQLLEKLGVEEGGTTPDGRITVEKVQCMGACERAPAIQVDGRHVGPVDMSLLEEWIRRLERE